MDNTDFLNKKEIRVLINYFVGRATQAYLT